MGHVLFKKNFYFFGIVWWLIVCVSLSNWWDNEVTVLFAFCVTVVLICRQFFFGMEVYCDLQFSWWFSFHFRQFLESFKESRNVQSLFKRQKELKKTSLSSKNPEFQHEFHQKKNFEIKKVKLLKKRAQLSLIPNFIPSHFPKKVHFLSNLKHQHMRLRISIREIIYLKP